MTRKHYVIIANVLNKQRPTTPTTHFDEYSLWLDIVDEFCDALKEDNPNFDEDRFRRVCEADND